jgi:hypothetical protein
MAKFSFSLLASVVLGATAVTAMPLTKRIAQTIADSTQEWEKACDAAGGGLQCNPTSVTAFTTLLAAAGPCDQQNAADQMIDLAKQLNNDADMIRLTQIFTQQPRNTPNSVAVPYCQQAPKNPELNGLFQCQFQGADQTTFVGGIKVGGAGTIPFGLNAPVSPPGSCPAHTSGPIPDGQQLVTITQDPGVSGSGSGSSPSASATPTDAPTSTDTTAPSATSTADSSETDSCDPPVTVTVTAGATPSASDSAASPAITSSAAVPTSTSAGSSSDFHLQNGKDAQALNAKFATFTADTSCSDGDQACIDGSFSQCVGGKFVPTGCAAGTQCFVLPLVNKPGTSLACTTQDDAQARIAATGAQGGIQGTGN